MLVLLYTRTKNYPKSIIFFSFSIFYTIICYLCIILANSMTPILTITGSDNTGWSGLQLDLRTITEMGGHALTSASCIVMQNAREIHEIYDFAPEVLQRQISSIIADIRPKAVKVGLVRTAEAVKIVRNEIIGCRNIVVAPGFLSSRGTQLIDDDTIIAIHKHLIPEATLLMLRCIEAERLLGNSIISNDDMLHAAQQLCSVGARWVLLRGGKTTEGRVTALLYSTEPTTPPLFFSSYNVEGWQQHGVGGALSAAIATRLGMGDEVPVAIRKAHEYVHSQVVYSVGNESQSQRAADIYNTFMSLITEHYATAHDVAFYADRLSITPRYLSQTTERAVSKSPKQVITDYLMTEARQMLLCSRLTIQEIALRLGFSSQASFNTFFRKQEKKSPSEFRGNI